MDKNERGEAGQELGKGQVHLVGIEKHEKSVEDEDDSDGLGLLERKESL